ncbi:MAG TPA: hypothetical protein VG222_08225 [Vicinamibacterales bacterium]|jgi:hypothetical protein|nr:hypothetical protein [Vicinamibacterales bacterium]
MTKTETQEKAELMLDVDLASYVRGCVPTDAEMAAAPLIEDWFVVISAPDARHLLKVTGKVYRYGPPVPNGQGFTTSAVIWFDRHQRFVRTATKLYALGRPVGHRPA